MKQCVKTAESRDISRQSADFTPSLDLGLSVKRQSIFSPPYINHHLRFSSIPQSLVDPLPGPPSRFSNHCSVKDSRPGIYQGILGCDLAMRLLPKSPEYRFIKRQSGDFPLWSQSIPQSLVDPLPGPPSRFSNHRPVKDSRPERIVSSRGVE